MVGVDPSQRTAQLPAPETPQTVLEVNDLHTHLTLRTGVVRAVNGFSCTLKKGETTEYPLGADRHAYLVPATGKIEINGTLANARDGVAISDTETLTVTALEDAELVMVDAA